MPYANDRGSSWNAWGCLPLDPDPDSVGDPCTVVGNGVSGIDSCEEGAMCWDVDMETLEGICATFCTGSPEDPTCVASLQCVYFPLSVMHLCLPACDPLFQDCADEQACRTTSGGQFYCESYTPSDMGAYGDPCEYANACDPGLVCLNPEYVPDCKAGGCCTPFCDTTAPNTCPGQGQECIAWYEEGMAPPWYEKVGVCGVPQ